MDLFRDSVFTRYIRLAQTAPHVFRIVSPGKFLKGRAVSVPLAQILVVPGKADGLNRTALNAGAAFDPSDGQAVIPVSVNIRMKAKGVWTYIYMPHPEMERKGKAAAERTERRYDETGEVVPCQECGCIDFVKKGEEYVCAICCQSNSG